MRPHKILYMVKKHRLRSVYSQLIAMIAALTLVFAILTITLLNVFRSSMVERATRMQEASLASVVEQLDDVVRNSYQAIYAVIGSTDVVDRILNYDRSIETYTEYQEIKEVISRLYMVKNSDLNVRNLFIIQRKYDFIIDPSGITDKAVYFRNHLKRELDFWEELAEKRHRFTLQISEDGSSLYVLHSMYAGGGEWFATLCMELDLNGLYDRESFREFRQDRIICVTDGDGGIVGYLSENRDDGLVEEAIQKGKVPGQLVLCGSTSGKELNIVSLIPMGQVMGDITGLFGICLLVFAVVMLLGILIAFRIANHIYRPLYHAMELIEAAGHQDGNDEIEILEHNVNTILRHNQDVTTAIARSAPIMLETMFQRIIMDVDSSENFEEMVDILPIEVRGGCYLTVVILEETALPDMDRRINDVFGGDIVSVFKRHKDEYVLILYQQQENFREEVRERCEALLRQTDVLIGVGKTYPDIYGIGRSYHDALRALDNRRADAEEAVVWDAEAMGESARYRIPSNAESVLYNYLVSGNSGLVRETIAQSLEKNRKSGIGFKEYLQLIGVYEEYLARVYETMDPSAAKGIPLLAYEGPSYTMAGVEKRVEVLLENYGRVAEFYRVNSHTDTVEEIMAYIEENLDRDIGLEDVAAAVNLTPNYITKYFKSKSGINFKNFLTMKRLERAKELLVETDLTVKDIAERCGYNSSKQLIVNFTKDTGLSPTEYRRRAGEAG